MRISLTFLVGLCVGVRGIRMGVWGEEGGRERWGGLGWMEGWVVAWVECVHSLGRYCSRQQIITEACTRLGARKGAWRNTINRRREERREGNTKASTLKRTRLQSFFNSCSLIHSPRRSVSIHSSIMACVCLARTNRRVNGAALFLYGGRREASEGEVWRRRKGSKTKEGRPSQWS